MAQAALRRRRTHGPRGRGGQHLRALGRRRAGAAGRRHRLAHRRHSHAGRYDGTVGVLGGLEAIRALQRAGFRPRRSIELIIFTAEEPTRFGIGCLGSRLLSGTLDAVRAARSARRARATLDEVRAAAGFSGSARSVALPAGYYSRLRRTAHRAGTAARARPASRSASSPRSPRRRLCDIKIEGEGGHAGAVLMPDRRDAFAGRCRNRARGGSGGQVHRRDRHRRHRRRLRGLSRRGQQHPQPRADDWPMSAISTWRAATPCLRSIQRTLRRNRARRVE